MHFRTLSILRVALLALLVAVLASGCGTLEKNEPAVKYGSLVAKVSMPDATASGVSPQYLGVVDLISGKLVQSGTTTEIGPVNVTPGADGSAVLQFDMVPKGTWELKVVGVDTNVDRDRYRAEQTGIVIGDAPVTVNLVLLPLEGSLEVQFDPAKLTGKTYTATDITSVTADYQVVVADETPVIGTDSLTFDSTNGIWWIIEEPIPAGSTVFFTLKLWAGTTLLDTLEEVQIGILPGEPHLKILPEVPDGSGAANIDLAAVPEPPSLYFAEWEETVTGTGEQFYFGYDPSPDQTSGDFSSRNFDYAVFYRPNDPTQAFTYVDRLVPVSSDEYGSYGRVVVPGVDLANIGQFALATIMDDMTFSPLSNIEDGVCYSCPPPPTT